MGRTTRGAQITLPEYIAGNIPRSRTGDPYFCEYNGKTGGRCRGPLPQNSSNRTFEPALLTGGPWCAPSPGVAFAGCAQRGAGSRPAYPHPGVVAGSADPARQSRPDARPSGARIDSLNPANDGAHAASEAVFYPAWRGQAFGQRGRQSRVAPRGPPTCGRSAQRGAGRPRRAPFSRRGFRRRERGVPAPSRWLVGFQRLFFARLTVESVEYLKKLGISTRQLFFQLAHVAQVDVERLLGIGVH